MKKKWIRKGDKVVVIAGNDKGKVGEVLQLNGEKILVKGVNVRKKHMKRRDQNSRSEIISIECPVNVSNVALCKDDGSKIKLNVSLDKDGSKNLVYNDGKKQVVHRTLKKREVAKQ